MAENITYDEGRLEEQLMELGPMQTDQMEDPVNAWYTFQNGHFEIIPEEEGTALDTAAMLESVKKQFQKDRHSCLRRTAASMRSRKC